MPELHLGDQVLDKGLVSSSRKMCGKVDDLLLSWDNEQPSKGPIVKSILCGPTALAPYWPPQGFWLAIVRFVYRLLGVHPVTPIEVPWDRVEAIDVVVWLNVPDEENDLERVDEAIRRRFIEPLPGA